MRLGVMRGGEIGTNSRYHNIRGNTKRKKHGNKTNKLGNTDLSFLFTGMKKHA